MQRQGTMWHNLAVLAVLASVRGLDVFAGADTDKKEKSPRAAAAGGCQGLARHRRKRRVGENGPG